MARLSGYDVSELIKAADKLKSERMTWETMWQEIADYILPRKSDIIRNRTRGSKRNIDRYSSAGTHALSLLAASLHGTLTSKSMVWFGLTLDGYDTAQLKEA